jgi:pimeloyl-ACP methyl ester carboxylesterase
MEPYFTHAADLDVLLFLRMLQAAGEHSAEEVLPTVQVPVLVVAGERDSFTPPEQAEAIAAALPRAELLMIPGATHVAPLEQHELVALRLEKFFTDCGLS